MTRIAPYLSIVAISRNDNHGGYLLERMQLFIDSLADQCNRYRIESELIIVEWNPPAKEKQLHEILHPPANNQFLKIRIIGVPGDIHAKFENSDKIPLFQMIGKNVGIRRAEGTFVLATNIDILFSDELMHFIAKKHLRHDVIYRVDRTDCSSPFSESPDRSVSKSPESMRLYCREHPLRVNRKYGTYPAGSRTKQLLGQARFLIDKVRFHYTGIIPFYGTIHGNGCGDFTLMSRSLWMNLGGYPELPIFSWNIDALLLIIAYHTGIREIDLRPPEGIYHIEHEAGSGWAPGEGERLLFKRLKERNIPVFTWEECTQISRTLQKAGRKGIRFQVNKPDWGLHNHNLDEAGVSWSPGFAVQKVPNSIQKYPSDVYFALWKARTEDLYLEDLLIAGDFLIIGDPLVNQAYRIGAFLKEISHKIKVSYPDDLSEIAQELEEHLRLGDQLTSISSFLTVTIKSLRKVYDLRTTEGFASFVHELVQYSDAFELFQELSWFLKLPISYKDTNHRTELKDLILQDVPELSDSSVSDIRKAIHLRKWAHDHALFSSENQLLESFPGTHVYTSSPEDLLAHFLARDGGAWCGGFAYFLQQLYETFGFEAYTVNMGIPETRISHMVVMVKLHDQNRVILSVQDPFFDLCYKSPDGCPLDYFELLTLVASGRDAQIVIDLGKNREIDFIIGPDESLNQYAWFVINTEHPRYVQDRIIYRAKATMDSFNEYFKAGKILLEAGYPPDLKSLFLLPMSIHRNIFECPDLLKKANKTINRSLSDQFS